MMKVSFSSVLLLLYYNKLLVMAEVENWEKNRPSQGQGSTIHII
jgi:hypothetical protein